MSEEIKNKYDSGNFIKILIDKELIEERMDFYNLLNLIKQSIRLVPLLGAELNKDLKYEVALMFDSKKIKINKISKEISIKKS